LRQDALGRALALLRHLQIVDEKGDLVGRHRSWRIVDEAARQGLRGLEQEKVLGILEHGLQTEGAVPLDDGDLPFEILATRFAIVLAHDSAEIRAAPVLQGIDTLFEQALAHHQPLTSEQAGIVGGAYDGIKAEEQVRAVIRIRLGARNSKQQGREGDQRGNECQSVHRGRLGTITGNIMRKLTAQAGRRAKEFAGCGDPRCQPSTLLVNPLH